MTKNLNLIFVVVGGGGGYLHTVEHMVQSTFQIILITFKHKPYNSYFEFYRKRILTKNQNLIFWGGGGGRVQGQCIKERGEWERQSNN